MNAIQQNELAGELLLDITAVCMFVININFLQSSPP